MFSLDVTRKRERDMPYRWDDDYGARLGVLRREDPYGEIRWFSIDPYYVFHVVNAYDAAAGIVLQAVRYPELWRHNGGFDVDAVMWSWVINLATGAVDERQLYDRGEFPRIDDRLGGLPARYSVTAGDSALLRYDLDRNVEEGHRFGRVRASQERRCSSRAGVTNWLGGTSHTSTTPSETPAIW